MAKFSMMVAVLLAAAFLAPDPAAAAEQGDAAAKLEAFAGVDHFAADPAGPYKGVADPKLHAKLNKAVDSAATWVEAGIRKGKPIPDLLQRLKVKLWLIDPRDLDPQDTERVTKAFVQLLSLAGLGQYDGILILWLHNYDKYKPTKTPAPTDYIQSGG